MQLLVLHSLAGRSEQPFSPSPQLTQCCQIPSSVPVCRANSDVDTNRPGGVSLRHRHFYFRHEEPPVTVEKRILPDSAASTRDHWTPGQCG